MNPIRNALRKLMIHDSKAPEVKIWLEFISLIVVGFLAYLFFWLIFGNFVLRTVLAVSIFILVLSIYLFRMGQHTISICVAIITFLAACLTVDYLLGWDFNSHYFILCVFPLLATKGLLSPITRAVLYFSAAASYIFGKKLMPLDSDLFTMPEWIMEYLPTLNLVVAILIIGLSMLKFSQIMADNERRLIAANEQMTQLANTDQLTGIYNRRYMYSVLEDEKFSSGSNRLTYVIAILDIDNFKQINDRFGHLTGDRVLQEIVQIILGVIRTGDIVARWGGEEFLVLLPNTDIVSGMAVMERVRQTLASKVYKCEGVEFQTTLTIGLADNIGKQRVDDIISTADERLYIGKRQGKNKIITKS